MMKPALAILSAVLTAAVADATSHSAAAADAFDVRLQCGPLINNHKIIDKDFTAKITAYNDKGHLHAARNLKKTPGRELFEGGVDGNGELSISGNGAFDDPTRHTWTYQFRGRIARNGATVLGGGMSVTETGAKRECNFALDEDSGKSLAASAPRPPITSYEPAASDARPNQFSDSASHTAETKLVIDGIELGRTLNRQSGQYNQYHCTPSKTFLEHTWCQRTEMGHSGEGDFAATNMFLQSSDGSAAYISRAIKPAHFVPGDIDSEIARLSRHYGTPRILRSGPGQTPSGVIAYWGSLKLTPLDADTLKLIATGHPSGKGFLFDFMENFTLSAQNGFEVYRASEGRGYVWSATFDNTGTGVLRMTAIDSAAVGAPVGPDAASVPVASFPSSTSTPTPQPTPASIPTLSDASKVVPGTPTADASASQNTPGPGFETFARLTELPSACVALKNMGAQATWPRGWAKETRETFSGRYSASDVCKSALECLPALSTRLKPIVEYLRTRPLLYAALKREAEPSEIMSLDSAIEILASRIDLSISDCQVSVVTLDRLMARNGADPGHIGIPAPVEYLQTASRNLIADLRKDHDANAASYSAWLPYAKHYERAAQLAAQKRNYEQAFGGPDIETALDAAENFNHEMKAADTFEDTLLQQGTKLAELSERLKNLAEQAAHEPISKIVKPNTANGIQSAKTAIDDLGRISAPERGDVSLQLSQFETRTDNFQSDLKEAQDRLDAMLQQGAKLTALSAHLADFARQAAQEPLSKLVTPNEAAAIEKLKAETDSLAKTPVSERGDVADQLARLQAGTNAVQVDLKEAQDKASQESAGNDSDLNYEKDKVVTSNSAEHIEVSQSRMASGIGMITHISIRSRENVLRVDKIELNRGNCKVLDVMGVGAHFVLKFGQTIDFPTNCSGVIEASITTDNNTYSFTWNEQ
jgi:hypothetical protein